MTSAFGSLPGMVLLHNFFMKNTCTNRIDARIKGICKTMTNTRTMLFGILTLLDRWTEVLVRYPRHCCPGWDELFWSNQLDDGQSRKRNHPRVRISLCPRSWQTAKTLRHSWDSIWVRKKTIAGNGWRPVFCSLGTIWGQRRRGMMKLSIRKDVDH